MKYRPPFSDLENISTLSLKKQTFCPPNTVSHPARSILLIEIRFAMTSGA
jgi:hypothetical protein